MYIPGTVLLWAALLLGLASTIAFARSLGDSEGWLQSARQTYGLMTAAIAVASILLLYLLLAHDYRLAYVWAYSDNSLPLSYLVSTFWAGQEGSFLLWALCGALLGLPLMRLAHAYEERVMVVYNLTVISLLVLLLKQNPFSFHEGLAPGMTPVDGQGLNPLLQNPWMVIHPPVMFLGYASLAIPFAFAIAGLWMRRYDEWARVSFPWVLLSTATLGLAIMLGGYWAYETLGWGGYWGWDPVENASLVPWLVAVALAHGIILQRSRHRFRRLNLFLAVFAFLLVVYATFLTRSGVLSDFSVHSFVDLGITGWLVLDILVFLALGLGVLFWRWREIPSEAGDEPFVSRTIFVVLGILLLILVALVVGFGTSAPLISRLWGKPAQVGPEFYNGMGYWLALALAALLGVTPFLGWRRAGEGALRRAAITAGVTMVLVALGLAAGLRGGLAILYAAIVLFAFAASAWNLVARARTRGLAATGGPLAHVGVALMLLAFMTSGWLDRSEKLRLTLDQPRDAIGYSFVFRGVDKPTPTARDAMLVEVSRPGGRSDVLRPRMWVNQKSNQLVANPAIAASLGSDLYLAPVEFDPGEEAPPSARLDLVKGEPARFRDWRLTFERFDLGRQSAVPGALTVGIVIALERQGEAPAELEPAIVSRGDGRTEVAPVAIPGAPGASLRATGMNVDAGIVRVELLGLGGGVAARGVLHQGESLEHDGIEVSFAGFDMSGFEPQAGRIDFDILLDTTEDGSTRRLVSTVRGGAAEPVEVPGHGGLTVTVARIDAEGGAVELELVDPDLPTQKAAPMSLVLDVSTKPLISLVWIGTILAVAGTLLGLWTRRRDLTASDAVA